MAHPAYGARYLNGAGSDAGGVHDHRVLHGPRLAQNVDRLGHGRTFLAHGHVNALHAEAALVEDGVDAHGRLAGLAVTDDQLPLAAADGRHGVDGLDAGLEGFLHRLAIDDAGRLHLEPAAQVGHDRALTVDGFAQRVHHPAEQGVADRHRQDAAGRFDGLTLVERFRPTEHDGSYGVFVEVQGQTQLAAFELEQLVDRGVGKAGDPGDPVEHFRDPADLLGRDAGRVVAEVAPERFGDLVGVDGQLCHQLGSPRVTMASGWTRRSFIRSSR